jgi:hypothetical protein
MEKKPLAAITMVYNEPEYLPIWLNYYGSQIGLEHCYIIDHGTTDGSTSYLDERVNLIKIPRSPQDDVKRAKLVSLLCNGLLEYFDSVMYTDIDEIVVAEPSEYSNLSQFADENRLETVWAAGFEVQHVPDSESEIDLTKSISLQRNWVRLWGGECKCVLTRKPIIWAPGFHCSDRQLAFGPLFLFHLRYMDLNLGLLRLSRTRAQAWALDTAAEHQRWKDEFWTQVFMDFSRYPQKSESTLDIASPPLSTKINELVQSTEGRQGHVYKMDLNIYAHELWPLSQKFKGLF